ncbi:MAG: hypothetical protein ACK4K0_00885 [Flavobacteriales bacterium]
MRKNIALLTIALIVLAGCKKKEPIQESEERYVIFKFKFDESQARLDNLGNPSTIPANHGAQSPRFNKISAHYIELAPNQFTQVGNGKVLYHAPETTQGGSTAIDFSKAIVVSEGQTFLKIPISQIAKGNYDWLRVSLSYQNYTIDYRASGFDLEGTIASFVGYNNYIGTYKINQQNVTINANKLQGYWGFETLGNTYDGQAPGTTVPNPIAGTSPIPAGSCVVTGQFSPALSITGNETKDIVITISLSTNNSFEWYDANQNGIYEPLDGDTVVDMGIRGLIPILTP